VFVGTPVTVIVQHLQRKLGEHAFPYTNYHVNFAVKESFKGITTPYVVSENGSGSGDCSYGKMDEGREYIIYAGSMSRDSVVTITACSRTQPLDGGLGDKIPPGDLRTEEITRSMVAAQKARRKELVLLRKLSNSTTPAAR
jgi:hypothetical protein